MAELLLSLSKLFLGFLCILGPVVLLSVLLHGRDRREAALRAAVLRQLNSPDLRGLFSARVQSRSIGGDAVVVDLWGCSREQVWNVMERLSVSLPAHVRVEVNGLSDCLMRSAWTLTATRRFSSAALCP
jgi:hypothetical protein